MLLVFGAIPFTDAMIVKYIDDRMRSRVTGARLAIGFGVSSFVVALMGPTVKAAGFPTLLMAAGGRGVLLVPSPSRCLPARARDGQGGAEARRVKRAAHRALLQPVGAFAILRGNCRVGVRSCSSDAACWREPPAGPSSAPLRCAPQTWPQPAGQDRGALSSRAAPPTPRAASSPRRWRAAGPAGDRREPRRRQHHHRHGAGRQVEARRPHPAARHHDAGDQRRARPEAALRSAEGLPADLDAGRHPRPDRRTTTIVPVHRPWPSSPSG